MRDLSLSGYQRTAFYTDQIKGHRPLKSKGTAQKLLRKSAGELVPFHQSRDTVSKHLQQESWKRRLNDKNLYLQLPHSAFQWRPQNCGAAMMCYSYKNNTGQQGIRLALAQNTAGHTDLKANSRESGSDVQPCCLLQRWRHENQGYKHHTLQILAFY